MKIWYSHGGYDGVGFSHCLIIQNLANNDNHQHRLHMEVIWWWWVEPQELHDLAFRLSWPHECNPTWQIFPVLHVYFSAFLHCFCICLVLSWPLENNRTDLPCFASVFFYFLHCICICIWIFICSVLSWPLVNNRLDLACFASVFIFSSAFQPPFRIFWT